MTRGGRDPEMAALKSGDGASGTKAIWGAALRRRQRLTRLPRPTLPPPQTTNNPPYTARPPYPSLATTATTMKYSLAGVAGLAALTAAQGTWPSDIVGTWSTKSNKTLTGPVRPNAMPYYRVSSLTSLCRVSSTP